MELGHRNIDGLSALESMEDVLKNQYSLNDVTSYVVFHSENISYATLVVNIYLGFAISKSIAINFNHDEITFKF